MNSGAMMAHSPKTGKNYRVRMADVGTPDIMAFKIGGCDPAEWGGGRDHVELLFIEVKQPKKNPTVFQSLKMKELESFGARCLVIHSLEELESQL
jgi:hypothetical protein